MRFMVGPHLMNVAIMIIIITIIFLTLPLILLALGLIEETKFANKGSQSMSLCYIIELKVTSVILAPILFISSQQVRICQLKASQCQTPILIHSVAFNRDPKA